ncbi:MAG TPA: TolC family protein [Acidobacteriaceae bacterium]
MTTTVTMDVTPTQARNSTRMSIVRPYRLFFRPALRRFALIALILGVAGSLLTPAQAQLSLGSAVDLALRNNPRVLGAQDEVNRARAALAEAHDVYIPSAAVGSAVGQAYGYVPYPPTLFSANAGSLVFSASQHDYVLSARAGLQASEMSLQDIQETVAQDTVLSFLALDHDRQRAEAIHQQFDFANKLASISQDRINAGQDSQMDLTQAKLTAAQLKLAALHADDDFENDRDHLARLIGVPAASLSVDGVFPSSAFPAEAPSGPYANAAVAAAFFSAQARQDQAKGDSRFRFWPQINLVVNYQRYATFTDSFKNLENIYKGNNGQTLLTANETAFGIQVNVPLFDKSRSDKAHETTAQAAHAMHDAQNAQLEALDGQGKLRHSIAELQAQSDVAMLQQQLAQQQLDVLRQQLQSGTGNPNDPQMTPKDEQKARIDERDKYIAVLDATFELRQAEVQLLRQTGQLITWIGAGNATKSASFAPSQTLGPTPPPK